MSQSSEIRERLARLTANLRTDPVTSKLFSESPSASRGRVRAHSPGPAFSPQSGPRTIRNVDTAKQASPPAADSPAGAAAASPSPGHRMPSPGSGDQNRRPSPLSLKSLVETHNLVAPKPNSRAVRDIVYKYLRAKRDRENELSQPKQAPALPDRRRPSVGDIATTLLAKAKQEQQQQQQQQQQGINKNGPDVASPEPIRPQHLHPHHHIEGQHEQQQQGTIRPSQLHTQLQQPRDSPRKVVGETINSTAHHHPGEPILGADRGVGGVVVRGGGGGGEIHSNSPSPIGGGVVILDDSPSPRAASVRSTRTPTDGGVQIIDDSSPEEELGMSSSSSTAVMRQMSQSGVFSSSFAQFKPPSPRNAPFHSATGADGGGGGGEGRISPSNAARSPNQPPVTVSLATDDTIRLVSTMSWKHSHSRLDALVLSIVHSLAHDAPVQSTS